MRRHPVSGTQSGEDDAGGSITLRIITINKINKVMIKLANLQKVYRTKEIETVALENVNLEVKKGDFLSIMGPSGCGKSTLLNIMGLLDAPTTGSVTIDGINTAGMNDREQAAFRNHQLGFVFQSFHLINSLNVLDNVELPLLYRKVSAAERRKAAKEVLEKVGLSHRMKHFPTQLSGGQCQRVAIARAIVGAPNIILADEPTGNLDSRMGIEVMDILHALNREDGRTIVMVTHNEHQARQTSRTIRFFDGRQIQ
jgi:putative ABC transport system ATP-binding protein